MDINKLIKQSLVLLLVCVISAGLLSGVYLITKDKIDNNAQIAYKQAMEEVLPVKGKAVTCEAQGYSAPIQLLVGVGQNGKVVGIKVLSQRETPGLGANITDSKFLKQFIGKSAKDSIEAKQDIDAITGATISTKAVCKAVRKALGIE